MAGRLTHPDKVLWPERGLTKADLASYYEAAADRLLPNLAGRPVTLKRFNAGVDGEGFFQKNAPASTPPSVRRFETWTETSRRTVAYAVIADVEGLRWCAQSNALELHPWFSRADRPERPDLCAFDLDPSSPDQDVGAAACDVRDTLGELGLATLVKTSGKRGLHVYVPIERRYGIDELRAFTLAVARLVASRRPGHYTVEMRKADRGGRLLIDWSRAGGAQTLVAAWSPRATATATVSTPLSWDEVEAGVDPASLTVPGVLERPDPWAERPIPPQRLDHATAALREQGVELEVVSPRARTSAPRTRRRVDLGEDAR
ncbi:MAG: ATP-dependent DNA ligase [Acidimicrobiia bacterium]|nr:ATP-dependent DNA ligase [Acidimicrobiia bacterium]